MQLQVVTKETVLQSSRNEYNKYEWTKTVNRLAGYQNAKFYQDVTAERDTFYIKERKTHRSLACGM